MNVMCTQLLHTMRHVIPGGWEESLGVDVGSSVIKGSRMKFLRILIEDVQTRFIVPKRATRDASIGDVYGVELEGEDKDSEDEDMEQAGAVASSSSSDLRNPSAVPSTSSNPAARLVFRYDVDEAVLNAMERGRLHEWTKVEFKAICRKHGLSVGGGKGQLMERVTVHFQR